MFGSLWGYVIQVFLTVILRVFFLFVVISCTTGQRGVVRAAVNRDAEEFYNSQESESDLAVARHMVESAAQNLSALHLDLALSLNNFACYKSRCFGHPLLV